MKKILLIGILFISAIGCTSKSDAGASATSQVKTQSRSTVQEEKRTTNKDGSTEVTLSDGSSITFESGTSEEDIQAAIKAIQSGELKTSQGNLNGGSDTDQSEDIPASQADSIETFQ